MANAVELDNVSRWYGEVIGLSDVSWRVDGGIVGILGPNGAGKSTLIKLVAGLLRPSRGDVRLFGEPSFHSPAARARLGYCPEHEGAYDDLTALEFVTLMAELSGVPRQRAGAAAKAALAEMTMTDAMHRRVGGFSKGMRQRTKLAQSFVHDPDLILLDEPLTGVDPVARAQIMNKIRELGAAGKTVLVSSHVLHEIQAVTEEILVVFRGKVLAEGNVRRIRELIDRHPHRIRVNCARPRDLAAAVAGADHVARMTFESERIVVIETRSPDDCYGLIADAALADQNAIASLTSPDNSLGAVFNVLTDGEVRS